MKVLKIVLIFVLFSVFAVLLGSLVFILTSLWRPSTEIPEDESAWSSRSIQKISRTAMRIPNNKLNVDKKRRSALAPSVRNKISKQRDENKPTSPSNVIKKVEGSPRFPNMNDGVLQLDSAKYICNDPDSEECASRTSAFGELMQKELNRVIMYESNVYRSGLEKHNTYHVRFRGTYGQRRERQQLVCSLGGVPERIMVGLEPQAAGSARSPLRGRRFGTCAVVASAGALRGSRLGQLIDSHEMVLRFNDAPTENYTEDVGSKTTIRIMNSQVVSKPEFNFLEDDLYNNVSILIWDPADYTSTLEDWYRSPDYPLFQAYKRFLELNPDADIHVLNPQVLWKLWDVLQSSASLRIRRNPPSSGFLGLWFAVNRCETVRMFEYVPSARISARCHYYSDLEDRHCTLGAWHPLAQEKALANQMRNNSDFDVFQRGFINIPGVSSYKCPD